jgi:hypothetical protein
VVGLQGSLKEFCNVVGNIPHSDPGLRVVLCRYIDGYGDRLWECQKGSGRVVGRRYTQQIDPSVKRGM